jgi:hypothetical protein
LKIDRRCGTNDMFSVVMNPNVRNSAVTVTKGTK